MTFKVKFEETLFMQIFNSPFKKYAYFYQQCFKNGK